MTAHRKEITVAYWPSWLKLASSPCLLQSALLWWLSQPRHSEGQDSTTVTAFLSHFPDKFGRAESGLVATPALSSAAGAALAQCLLLCWGCVF